MGLQSEVLTFLGDRIAESISGETAPVVLTLFGDDLDVLDAQAAEAAALLRQVRGAQEVVVKAAPGAPHLELRLRLERLAHFGFRPVEVLEAIQTLTQGTVVAQTYRGNQVTDLAVTLVESARPIPETFSDLQLRNLQGQPIPLRELAEIVSTSGREVILHDGARRRQTVTCSVTGRDGAAFVQEAQATIAAKLSLPRGTYLEFSGTAEAAQAARSELLLHASIAAIGIVLLLGAVLGRARPVLLVLANVPFALVGGVLAVWLTRHGDAVLTLGGLFTSTFLNLLVLPTFALRWGQFEAASDSGRATVTPLIS